MRRIALVLLLVVAVGCTSTERYAELEAPNTPDAGPTTSTTELSALDDMPLAPVKGATPVTALKLGPGPIQRLAGRVDGPTGPVAGAIVHIERLGSRGVVGTNVPTAADGTWNVTNVLGGRYRIRAWLAPTLGMAKATTLFVAAPRPAPVVLRLASYDGIRVDAVIAPNPPVVGTSANLRIRVLNRSVDNQGYVRSAPVVGSSVTLAGSGSWAVNGANPGVTGSDGSVTFEVVCGAAGSQPLSAVLGDGTEQALALPPCQ